jgi:peptidyl-tRNA hydrolase, PTH1 family
LPLKLVVGLGNPGAKYARTRHNIGYRVIDALESSAPEGVRLFKPESVYMNEAGRPVAELMRRNGIQPNELLVICDDFSIPLKTLRIRFGGSFGGHNGLLSIIQSLGTPEIPRLRIGIGPVPEGDDPADFVLKNFSREESAIVEAMVGVGAEAAKTVLKNGLEVAMNQYNNKIYES